MTTLIIVILVLECLTSMQNNSSIYQNFKIVYNYALRLSKLQRNW